MQEETFQLQQNQVIEYNLRKYIKPLQRKSQSKTYEPEEFYSTLEAMIEANIVSNCSKRGTNFSIEEECYPRIVKNPFLNELPSFSKIQYQLNNTIHQQPEITYAQSELFHNDLSNQNNPEMKQQNPNNNINESLENLIGDDYKLIQIDDINYLQTFQNNNSEHQIKTLRDQKQIPKNTHQDLTKRIHKIIIKK